MNQTAAELPASVKNRISHRGKAAAALVDAIRQALDEMRSTPQAMMQTPPLSLYVHFPWCVRKCPYCDFNSHPAKGTIPETAYLDQLLRDLDSDLDDVKHRSIETIFIGGGTPSLISGRTIAGLLDGVRDRAVVCRHRRSDARGESRRCRRSEFRGVSRGGRQPTVDRRAIVQLRRT